MAQPLTAGLPPDLDLTQGYVIRFNALDPTTGDAVTGVNVIDATLFVQSLAGGALTQLQSGQFLLVSGSQG